MEREIFGPVLHVASFSADEIDAVIDAINARGYGLTFGLHTRIDERVQRIIDRIHAGNIYVNRNQIGAVVGSQPFGGEGLSGTGPKAGGPLYLRRFRKPATPVLPALGGTAAALPGLPEGAAEWAGRPDRISILRRHLRGRGAEALAAIAGVDAGPIDLPGPTGESNVLALVPRGTVVCAGPTTEALLSQVIQALGAGNAVIAVAPGAPAVLAPLISRGMPLAAADGIIDPAGLAGMEIAAVAIAGDETRLRAVRQALAARDGPIVGMITALIDPLAYFHERSVCVDTTAAGGNASLLSAS
jgi:RHH-type proline utilization regulon transcriptional repressor/proline dehydrogenase/delta 1-pyrroline-5-carboxylate dehydrogenase